jgi:hypothetical protein
VTSDAYSRGRLNSLPLRIGCSYSFSLAIIPVSAIPDS